MLLDNPSPPQFCGGAPLTGSKTVQKMVFSPLLGGVPRSGEGVVCQKWEIQRHVILRQSEESCAPLWKELAERSEDWGFLFHYSGVSPKGDLLFFIFGALRPQTPGSTFPTIKLEKSREKSPLKKFFSHTFRLLIY